MSVALEKRNELDSKMAILEKVVMEGDLSKLTPAERVLYYRRVCESLGLNPLTRPFDYIWLNGKLVLYARKDAAEQLRVSRGISIVKLDRQIEHDLCIITAYGRDMKGREDIATGAVYIGGLKGEALANAIMKAETKAKRRLTLSLAGLGWMDETEVESIPEAVRAQVDPDTGEIHDTTPIPQPKVTKAEVDEVLAWAKSQGLTQDQIRDAFQQATGRVTMRGWSHSRVEFDRWKEALQDLVESRQVEQQTTTLDGEAVEAEYQGELFAGGQ
ncbi:MAG: hypothetical protein IMX00_04410 [Limnochordales bacterium]|nr:hypothetical protein [Limnochordales bacterium]